MQSYPLAPWVGHPADPAAHYATGFQMGMHLGAEQAANIYRQQQLQREQQKDEFERQLTDQRQQLEVDKVIRKQRATANYQSLVAQGVDPMTALQSIGPDIADPAELVGMQQRNQAQMAERQQQTFQRASQMDLANRKLAEEARYHTGELAARTKSDSGPVTPEIQNVGGHELIVNPKTGHFVLPKSNVGKSQFIASNVSKWMNEQGISDPKEAAQKLSDFYDTYIEPPKDKTPETGANLTPPSSTEAPAETQDSTPKTGKVRVKNPDGQIGMIPSAQLDDALSMGYEEIK